MKTSGRVLATTLIAVAASCYAGVSSAGPHRAAMGFHAITRTTGIAGTGGPKGIAGTGGPKGIAGTGGPKK
jgi:hypothetical protein